MYNIISSLVKDDVFDIVPLADWNFSNGFIVEWKNKKYFVRKFKHNIHWYEYLHDQKWSFDNSHFMMNLNWINIKSYGVFEYEWFLYHIQDFTLWELISLENLNEDIIIKIANYISQLHINGKKDIGNFDNEKRKRLYNRSLREYITNFEWIFPLFENHISDEPFFREYLPKLFDEYFDLIISNNSDRLTTLHGDFWFGNILHDKISNRMNVIDFSIVPFWEPWIDIGRFVWDLEIWSLLKGQQKLQWYKKLFLDQYISLTWDKNIINYISYMYKLKGLKLLSPLVQKFLKWTDEEKNIVKNSIIVWHTQ